MRFVLPLLLSFSLLFSTTTKESISVRLSWLHQFQFAGFYVAKARGFYEDVGLDVTIKEYEEGIDIVQEVLQGKSTYGVDKTSLLIHKSQGKAVCAIMALFQESPSVLLTTNPAIRTVKDLKNKTLMVLPDETASVAIASMLQSQGISPRDVQFKPHAFGVEALQKGEVDAMAGYASNQPYLLEKEDVAHQAFYPKDFGFDFYGDIVFTSQHEINQYPERVKKFHQATKKGWEWAFENMEAAVELIAKSYNSQHKSTDALLFEARTLKKFAFANELPFGTLDQKKFEALATVYRLHGLLEKPIDWSNFIDPLHLSKQTIRIGALANRGDEAALGLWEEIAHYLSKKVPLAHFEIIPLDFRELSTSVRYQEIDFVITNPMYYVQLEHRYGASRIATLKHFYQGEHYSQFGSVIFTRSSNDPHKALEAQVIGAVDRHSFGGYLMALYELQNPAYMEYVRMFGTHDEVVYAVLDGRIDVGIVRTDILERMQEEEKIALEDITVLRKKEHEGFPFLVSTVLYPEWPFSKLKHTSDALASQVLSALLAFPEHKTRTTWGVPQDYSEVHAVLKELEIYPYEARRVTAKDLVYKHRFWFLALGALFVVVLGVLVHIRGLNKRLVQKAQEIENFNETLEKIVEERTLQLNQANAKLKELANTDELTKIDNRRRFFDFGEKYFYAAKRNKTPLCVLSLDIDFFKHVNDTYGHHVGDEVLKLFCATISTLIRKSDLFGRIGGEEFSICLQSTPLQGALVLAEKIRKAIEEMEYWGALEAPVRITVSIGIGVMGEEDATLLEIMNRADKALYVAKHSGRNQVQVV